MAAAVILIPEMLSGPRRAAPPAPTPAKPDERNLKRYTIDLESETAAKDASTTATVIEEPAPPPEESLPSDVATESAEPVATEQRQTPPAVLPAEDVPAAAVAAATEEPLPVQPSVEQAPAAAAPASQAEASATPTAGRRWAVQLIAYDRREQAQRMAEDLRSGNIAAFVMPVETKTGTLYRVRVGPFMARAEAEDALRKLKAVSSGATIVAQP